MPCYICTAAVSHSVRPTMKLQVAYPREHSCPALSLGLLQVVTRRAMNGGHGKPVLLASQQMMQRTAVAAAQRLQIALVTCSRHRIRPSSSSSRWSSRNRGLAHHHGVQALSSTAAAHRARGLARSPSPKVLVRQLQC